MNVFAQDVKNQPRNSGINILSQYIAPWALLREEIPLHLVWNPSFECDEIQIQMPPDVEVREVLNAEDLKECGSSIYVTKLKTPDFFGLVVAFTGKLSQQHERREIILNFISGRKECYTHRFELNVYRPILSAVANQKMVLKDDSHLHTLANVELRISGFGRIEVATELSEGGKFVPLVEPLYQEIVRRVITTFKLDQPPSDEKKEIEINKRYLEQMTEQFMQRLKRGEFPLDLSEDDLESFRKWLTEENNRSKLTKVISEHMENLLSDSLLFYFDRHPAEGVELSSGQPTMLVESATHALSIRFRYKDSLGNEYEPVDVKIDVDDQRSKKGTRTKVPINIHWIMEQIDPISGGRKC